MTSLVKTHRFLQAGRSESYARSLVLTAALTAPLLACGGSELDGIDPTTQAIQRQRPPLTQTPTARMDWSMPSTIDGDNPADPTVPTTAKLTQTSFRVVLDGCASTPESWGGPLARWDWTLVDGIAGERPLASSSTCQSEVLLEQGSFQVKLTVHSASGVSGSVTGQVVVKNHLVVVMGDSVASGEGNPDVRREAGWRSTPVWADRRCHRSLLSGPARAARVLEDADTRSSVTFFSVACSGASIDEGLLGTYAGQQRLPGDKPELLPSQVDAVVSALCPDGCPNGMRTIDSLILIAGANDVGFGTVVEKCGFPAPHLGDLTGCDQSDELNGMVKRGLQSLPDKYMRLNANIRTRLKPRTVLIGEYFDPTWADEVENPWRPSPPGPRMCQSMTFKDAGVGVINGIMDSDEIEWARNHVVLPLNDKVAAAAVENGWTSVRGIEKAFVGHGYCSADNWIVRYDESISRQGAKDGTMHPNEKGHEVYARAIGDSLSQQLLTGRPRADFNQDRLADIFWHHPETGTLSPWSLGASSGAGTPIVTNSVLSVALPGSSGWVVKLVADFNRDGSADILWYHPTTGSLSVWWLQGNTLLGHEMVKVSAVPASSGWDIVGSGDFDRDGNVDVLWHHRSSGAFNVWLMRLRGTEFKRSFPLSMNSTGSGAVVAGTGDFDKDGNVDVLWFNPSTGSLNFWKLDHFNVKASIPVNVAGPTVSTGWKLAAIDDFNRDGFADLMWHHVDGTLAVWNLDKGRLSSSSVLDWQIPQSSGWTMVGR